MVGGGVNLYFIALQLYVCRSAWKIIHHFEWNSNDNRFSWSTELQNITGNIKNYRYDIQLHRLFTIPVIISIIREHL